MRNDRRGGRKQRRRSRGEAKEEGGFGRFAGEARAPRKSRRLGSRVVAGVFLGGG